MGSQAPDARPPATAKGEGVAVAWRRRKDQRRPEILAAARTLIEAQGASRVSIARIAAEAGVSEATVYNYFPGKQALVDEVLREWAMPYIEQLTAELRSIVELRSRLVLIATRFLRSTEQTPKLHRVYYSEIRWEDYRGSEIHRLNARFTRSFVETVESGIASGEIEPGTDPAMFRDMLFGGLEHIAQRTLLAGRPLEIEPTAARYVDLMLQGARPRPAGGELAGEIGRLAAVVDRLERRIDTD
jgi:AcrR family transcriptional regulator